MYFLGLKESGIETYFCEMKECMRKYCHKREERFIVEEIL